jgi:hypothetical protein
VSPLETGHKRLVGLAEPALVLDAATAVCEMDLEPRRTGILQGVIEPVGDQVLGTLTPPASG